MFSWYSVISECHCGTQNRKKPYKTILFLDIFDIRGPEKGSTAKVVNSFWKTFQKLLKADFQKLLKMVFKDFQTLEGNLY